MPQKTYLDSEGNPLQGKGIYLDETGEPVSKPGFATGLREGLGIPGSIPEAVTMAKGLGQMVLHPYEAAKGIVGQQVEQFQKAGEALEQGSPIEAGGRVLAGALPLIGPAAARAGEAIGAGQTAYGVGQATGLVAPFGAAAAIRRVKPGVAPPPSPVRHTVGERRNSPSLLKLEGIAERTLPGAPPFTKFRAAQQRDLRKLGDQLVQKISTFPGGEEELGRKLSQTLNATKERIKGELGTEYTAIDDMTRPIEKTIPTLTERPSTLVSPSGGPLTVSVKGTKIVEEGGVPVSLNPLKNFAKPILQRINKESQIIPPQELKRTSDILQSIIDAPDSANFRTFHDVRSDLLAIARSYGDPIPGKAGGVAKKLAQVSTEAMEEAAKNSQFPDLLPRVKEANRQWKQLVYDYDETVVKRIIDGAPEKAHVFLKNAPLEDIRTVKRLAPDTFLDATARIVKEVIDDATEGELRAPTGLQHLADLTNMGKTPTLKAKKLRKALEDTLGQERLQALLSPPHLQGLYEVLQEAEKIGVSNAGLVSGAVNSYITIRGLTSPIAAAADIALLSAPLYLFSRLMVRQPKGWIPTIKNYIRATGRRDVTQAAFWSQRLGQFLLEEEKKANKKSSTARGGASPASGSPLQGAIAAPPASALPAGPYPSLQQFLSRGGTAPQPQ